MKILLTAASAFEVKPVLGRFSFLRAENNYIYEYQLNGKCIDVLITGPGIMTTAYSLGKLFALDRYDIAVNAGICGSYFPTLQAGEVLEIVEESITDLGAQEDGGFLSVFDLGLLKPDIAPFTGGLLINPGMIKSEVLGKIPKGKGATVSSIPGKIRSDEGKVPAYTPGTESMEGAAFFFACLREGIPFTEIRSVSNMVEERDKSKWEISLAVNNLNDILFDFLSEQTNIISG